MCKAVYQNFFYVNIYLQRKSTSFSHSMRMIGTLLLRCSDTLCWHNIFRFTDITHTCMDTLYSCPIQVYWHLKLLFLRCGDRGPAERVVRAQEANLLSQHNDIHDFASTCPVYLCTCDCLHVWLFVYFYQAHSNGSTGLEDDAGSGAQDGHLNKTVEKDQFIRGVLRNVVKRCALRLPLWFCCILRHHLFHSCVSCFLFSMCIILLIVMCLMLLIFNTCPMLLLWPTFGLVRKMSSPIQVKRQQHHMKTYEFKIESGTYLHCEERHTIVGRQHIILQKYVLTSLCKSTYWGRCWIIFSYCPFPVSSSVNRSLICIAPWESVHGNAWRQRYADSRCALHLGGRLSPQAMLLHLWTGNRDTGSFCECLCHAVCVCVCVCISH